MARRLTAILTGALAVALAGCSGDNNAGRGQDPAAPNEADIAVCQTVNDDGVEFFSAYSQLPASMSEVPPFDEWPLLDRATNVIDTALKNHLGGMSSAGRAAGELLEEALNEYGGGRTRDNRVLATQDDSIFSALIAIAAFCGDVGLPRDNIPEQLPN